jgi:hypothetical protein
MRRFTPEEDQFIRDNYLNLMLSEIGKHLDRTEGTVHQRLKVIGLQVPEEIKAARKQIGFNNLKESGKAHRFQKGNAAYNKGKKMPAHVYEKAKATMFKPGQKPKNTVHFGNPYLHMRTRDDGYVEKLWFIQESTNKRSAYLGYLCRQNGIDLTGKKPILKEGFDHSRAPTFEDIEIVTNAENMRRNSIHRYPEEIVKLCHIKGILKRQINNHLKLQENE